MKRCWLLFIATFVLCACILPLGEALALEPGEGGDSVWVLTDVVRGTEDETTVVESAMYGIESKIKAIVKESVFEYYATISKAGELLADAHFTYYYDIPPRELVPGETVQLAASGKVEDFVGTADQPFHYLVSLRKDDGSIATRLADQQYELNRENTQGSTMLQFVVPEATGGKLWIRPRISTSDQFYMIWVYTPGEASSSASQTATAASGTTSSTGSDDRPAWQKRAEQYVTRGGEIFDVPPWLQWLKPKELTQQRGTIIEPKGEVWVYDSAFGKWKGPLKADTTLYSGDRVRTGPKTTCRVVFTNKKGQQDVISVSSDTLVESPRAIKESPYPALWSLYEGAVRIKRAVTVITGGEIPKTQENPFIVRTPTIAGGTRGSLPDFNGAYCAIEEPGIVLAGAQPEPWLSTAAGPPAADEEWTVTEEFIVSTDGLSTSVYVISGELDYHNYQPGSEGDPALFVAAGGPKESVISSGQKLTVTDTGTESVTAFTGNELDSLVAAQGLDEPQLLGEQEVQALLTDDAEDSGGSILIPIIAGVVVVIGAGVIVWIMLARKKARAK